MFSIKNYQHNALPEQCNHEISGFTLIETVVIIVVVGIFMATIVMPFVEGVRETRRPEIVATAHFLAVEKLEELTTTAYALLSDEARAVIAGFTDYDREVDVTYVDSDLADTGSDQGYTRVTATVYHNDLPFAGISIVTLRTDY
jgi:type II secretory pathway pseudopilin PulG